MLFRSIPVTHRGMCEGVTFVTGHTGDGHEPDWKALASSRTTLVVYMGVAHAGEIAQRLISGGLRHETPAAAIQNGTLVSQKSTVTVLADLAAAMARSGIGSPAVLVIGDVVRFARTEQLSVELACVA